MAATVENNDENAKPVERDSTSLRQKTIAVLTQREEPLSYRELTNTLWAAYPEPISTYSNCIRPKRRRDINIAFD
jgi:hypothetical protein